MFKNFSVLKKHLEVAHTDELIFCEICGKAYQSLCSRDLHSLKVHAGLRIPKFCAITSCCCSIPSEALHVKAEHIK